MTMEKEDLSIQEENASGNKEKLITLDHISKHFHVGPRQTLVAVNNMSVSYTHLDVYKRQLKR